MPNQELHNDLKQLSGYVYRNNQFQKPKDWIEVGKSEGKNTGFYAETFVRGNDVVISFRGTDVERGNKAKAQDFVLSDIPMGAKLLPAQIVNAQKYYKEIKKQFPNSNIIFTGHSLGGSVAQILGAEYGHETVTFNAYGVGDLMGSYHVKNFDNITNYGNANDTIFAANAQNHIGNTYVIGDYEDNLDSVYSRTGINPDTSLWDYHSLDNMGDLSKALPYKGQNLQTEEALTLKASIEENVDLRDVDPDRILTREEVKEMSTDEFTDKEDFINQQLAGGKVMSKAEVEEKVQSGGAVWVEGYTRADGTQVKGYYRSK